MNTPRTGYGPGVRLDHVSYAVGIDEFPSTVSRLGALLGAPFTDGGVHPRYGTRNAVLPLAHGCYVEVVTPLDHPSTDAMPFGRAVRRRAELGGGWLGWVVGVDDITTFEKRLGRPSAEGHRRRPDGVLLERRQTLAQAAKRKVRCALLSAVQVFANEAPERRSNFTTAPIGR